MWGFGNGIQLAGSSAAHPVQITDNYIHDASANGGGVCRVDGILSNNGGTGMEYITVSGNTIVLLPSDTNCIGFQCVEGTGGSPYANLTITNNYISGDNTSVDVGTDPPGARISPSPGMCTARTTSPPTPWSTALAGLHRHRQHLGQQRVSLRRPRRSAPRQRPGWRPGTAACSGGRATGCQRTAARLSATSRTPARGARRWHGACWPAVRPGPPPPFLLCGLDGAAEDSHRGGIGQHPDRRLPEEQPCLSTQEPRQNACTRCPQRYRGHSGSVHRDDPGEHGRCAGRRLPAASRVFLWGAGPDAAD